MDGCIPNFLNKKKTVLGFEIKKDQLQKTSALNNYKYRIEIISRYFKK